MNRFTFSNFLIASLMINFSLAHEVLHLTSEKQYFEAGHQNKHFIAGLYNSEGNSDAEKVIDDMFGQFSHDPTFIEHDLRFAKIDFKDINIVITHYTIIGNSALYYYAGNQLQEFKEFGTMVDDFTSGKINKNQLFEKTHQFLSEKLERISKVIKSEQEFEEAVSKHKMIGVYFGDGKNENEKKFDTLALLHINFNFFKIRDQELSNKIYFSKTGKTLDKQELIAIVRDRSLVNELDQKQISEMDANKSEESYRFFYIYEKYPKLIKDDDGHHIFMDIMHKKAKLLLFTYKETSLKENQTAFLNAVKRLNKGMIYALADIHSSISANFMQIFLNSEEKFQMEADRMYFIRGLGHKFEIFEAPLSENLSELIYEDIWAGYRKKKTWFSEMEKELFEGDDGKQKVEADL